MSGASLTARLMLNPLITPCHTHSQATLPWSSSLTPPWPDGSSHALPPTHTLPGNAAIELLTDHTLA